MERRGSRIYYSLVRIHAHEYSDGWYYRGRCKAGIDDGTIDRGAGKHAAASPAAPDSLQ